MLSSIFSRRYLLELKYKYLIRKLPIRAPIYLPTDKLSLDEKIIGIKKVWDIYHKKLDRIYRPKLKSLRQKYYGHNRCFLIGNGPSLNRTDLSLLKNEITFAVNGFFLKFDEIDWKPTFYVVEDHLVAEDRAQSLNQLKGSIKLFPAYLAYCLDESEDTIFFNHRPRISYPHGFDFSTDASEITYTGCTVMFTCLQLAFYMGFKEIFLIGVDADYELPEDVIKEDKYGTCILDMPSGDLNHFHPDYFGKGFRWHDPQVHKMIEAFREVRRLTETTNQRVYNATIGGKLEVFERRDYKSLFTQKVLSTPKEHYPRLLMIDMTPVGHMSATGQVKKSFLGDWPQEKFLQLWNTDTRRNDLRIIHLGQPIHDSQQVIFLVDEAVEHAINFNPEIIYFRPVDMEVLFEVTEKIITKISRPLVLHIMDDWPERLKLTDKDRFERINPRLINLINKAKVLLSIGQSMSDAFKMRYGGNWVPLANGVDLADFPSKKNWDSRSPISPDHPFVIRYMGGLAEDMSFASVKDIAVAVSELRNTFPIRLEIRTMEWYLRKAKEELEKYPGVSVDLLVPAYEYNSFLCQADALVIAYNFDDKSIAYTKFSLANKMPECLASGALVFAYGPRQSATIDYLLQTECAVVVTKQGSNYVKSEIQKLLLSQENWKVMSEKSLKYVSEHMTRKQVHEKFLENLRKAISISDIQQYDVKYKH